LAAAQLFHRLLDALDLHLGLLDVHLNWPSRRASALALRKAFC